jgi:ADP-ribose pyrophosphatase YjhB (NUDIX family)
VTSSRTGRTFACFPAAVLVFVVDQDERILLLKAPYAGGWEVINGALEHGETVLEGALRETREEAGPDLRVRPLGIVHTYTHFYDENGMISISYLMACEEGAAIPGDDMAGSEIRWMTVEEIEESHLILIAPRQKWLVRRAVELYRLWRGADIPPLEKPPGQHGDKYGRDHP